MKASALVLLLFTAACSHAFPEIRPLPIASGGGKESAFDAAYSAGKTHLRAGRIGLALVMFQRAIAIDPLSVAALNAAGAACDELHRPDLAGRYYAKALIIEPNSADTLNNMAVSAAMAGDRDVARKLLTDALALDPSNDAIRRNAYLKGTARKVLVSTQIPEEPRPSIERSGVSETTLTIPSHARPASVSRN